MKKALFISILFLVIAGFLSADTLYVKSRMCPLFDEAKPGAEKIIVLKQGDELEVLEVKGPWIQVTAEGKTGWVKKMFTGDAPPLEKIEEGKGLNDLSNVVSRRRASAYTTSAAATRGLSSDNVRDRENLSFDDYDFNSIDWLDEFTYSEEEIVEFAESEGLAL